MKKTLVALVVAVSTFGSLSARGEGELIEDSGSPRLDDRLGFYASLYGDPYPALFGVNVAYNVYEFIRVTAGVGADDIQRPQISTVGAGVKALVPGLPLTPVVGLNVGALVTNNFAEVIRSRGFSAATMNVYANAGLDWQTTIGLNVGAGVNYSFIGGSPYGYVNAGVFL